MGVSDAIAEAAYATSAMTEEEAAYMSSAIGLNVPDALIVHEPSYVGYQHIPDVPPESLVCE